MNLGLVTASEGAGEDGLGFPRVSRERNAPVDPGRRELLILVIVVSSTVAVYNLFLT